MKRFVATALAVLLASTVAVTGAATPAMAATPAIEITKVYYDSPGADKGSNKSLNAEYVRLTNRKSKTINLKGWTLRDKAKHVYTFKGDVKIAPGKHIVVHTGKGKNTKKHRYWGRSWYVWNNNGDKAYLRNAKGKTIDTCSWGKGGKGYTYCK